MIVLAFHCVAGYSDDTTTVHFLSDTPLAVYRITSIIADERENSPISDFGFYLKDMELITVAPGAVELPNGDYLFAFLSSDEKVNHDFAVALDGTDLDISLKPAPGYLDALLYSFMGSSILTAVTLEKTLSATDTDFWNNPVSYVSLSAGAIALTSIVLWVANLPSAKIRESAR